MAKVLCTLPNAAEEINGVAFSAHDRGMLSDEISDERAAEFAEIPGYLVVGAAAPDEKAAERAALVDRAQAAGVAIKGNWGLDRLRAEVEAAEAAKKA